MFSEHISGARRTVCDPLLDRQPRAAAGGQLHDGVGLGAQPLVQLAVDRRVHRVGAVGVARVDVQNRRARAPRRDALLDDLVGLLGQVGVGLLAVDPAGQRTGDDDRLGGRLPGHASTVLGHRLADEALLALGLGSGWPMKSSWYVSGERYAAIAEIEHMAVK